MILTNVILIRTVQLRVFYSSIRFKMNQNSPNNEEGKWVRLVKQAIPILRNDKHKGQDGRIGIIGGSLEYTGAPYFAAISSLKVGADLSHVFCTKAAAPVIKSYSPELIVHPLLDVENSVEEISPWLDRIHVLIIGPGLGRDTIILQNVAEIIKLCREQKKPLVIDADGLFLITENIDLIRNYPHPGVILTPNKVEFNRLYQVIKSPESNPSDGITIDFNKLGKNILILRKGSTDETFCIDSDTHWTNSSGGSARRCGGQGDLMSGSIGTFFNWSINNLSTYKESMVPAAVACFGASRLTRTCNQKAFYYKGRSMVCSDMIEKIHEAFDDEFEVGS